MRDVGIEGGPNNGDPSDYPPSGVEMIKPLTRYKPNTVRLISDHSMIKVVLGSKE